MEQGGQEPFRQAASKATEGMVALQEAMDAITAFVQGVEPDQAAPGATVTPRPSPTPQPLPTPTAAVSSKPIALGDTLETRWWEITVVEASVLPNLRTGQEFGFIAVTLDVTNTTTEERNFGLPESDFSVEAGDGRLFRYDFLGTASIQAAQGEWTGNYAPGTTHRTTLAFNIPQADPQLKLGEPTDLVLNYYEDKEDDQPYRMELGI
ncbi:MAG: DUF4352 domain-containing protein [Chloroflexota bacterium]|nr:DUF4352 domain-containing protein [Chloroflexota bacterium]